MSQRWAKGSTGSWRRIRSDVLARDGYLCQLKIPGVCTVKATQVHHKLPRELAHDNPEYLCATCQPCNNKVGDPAKPQPQPKIEEW